jgi:spore germination protein KC
MKTKLTRIRMRVISLLLVISMMVVSYSGCWSRVEIEKMSFISVVGVDRAGSDLLVSFQIVNPSALAKTGLKSVRTSGKGGCSHVPHSNPLGTAEIH